MKQILLDADVFRHFEKAGKLDLLPQIFDEKIVMLDIVKNEIARSRRLVQPLNDFINNNDIEVLPINDNDQARLEFARLIRTGLGDGESACMAVARYSRDKIASSNLRDIASYCNEHQIEYLTTMQFLHKCYTDGILSEAECDFFIYNVKSKNSRLPCDTIKEYIEKYC